MSFLYSTDFGLNGLFKKTENRVLARGMFSENTMISLRKHIGYVQDPAAFRKVRAKRHVRACRFT